MATEAMTRRLAMNLLILYWTAATGRLGPSTPWDKKKNILESTEKGSALPAPLGERWMTFICITLEVDQCQRMDEAAIHVRELTVAVPPPDQPTKTQPQDAHPSIVNDAPRRGCCLQADENRYNFCTLPRFLIGALRPPTAGVHLESAS